MRVALRLSSFASLKILAKRFQPQAVPLEGHLILMPSEAQDPNSLPKVDPEWEAPDGVVVHAAVAGDPAVDSILEWCFAPMRLVVERGQKWLVWSRPETPPCLQLALEKVSPKQLEKRLHPVTWSAAAGGMVKVYVTWRF
jgi:hypothetical protein